MRQRPFGSTGLMVSELGVGCSRLGGLGSSSKEEMAMLAAAADAGVTFFDTSDLYAQGRSEELVGKALRRRRDTVVIATKGGYLVPRQRKLLARAKPLVGPLVRRVRARRATSRRSGGATVAGQDFSPRHLRTAVEGSLRRLRVDCIDLYQLHSPPRTVIEAGDFVATLERLRADGKIRHWGIAADGPDDVDSLDLPAGTASLQLPFGVAHQGAAQVIAHAADRGIGVIARSCYAAGLLREDLDPDELQRVAPDWEILLRARSAIEALGRPALETALLFDLAVPSIAVTIVGMRTVEHLRGNLHHLAAPRLSEHEIDALTR